MSQATDLAATPTEPASAPANPLSEGLRTGLASKVPTNPAFLEWPTDKHGVTSDLKKHALAAIGKIKGNKERHDLVMFTLGVLAKHAMTRYLADKDYQLEQIKLIQEAADKRPTR